MIGLPANQYSIVINTCQSHHTILPKAFETLPDKFPGGIFSAMTLALQATTVGHAAPLTHWGCKHNDHRIRHYQSFFRDNMAVFWFKFCELYDGLCFQKALILSRLLRPQMETTWTQYTMVYTWLGSHITGKIAHWTRCPLVIRL